ncbi:MAG: hypothetical protein QOJ42_5064 [Acidobacteriaceae bacterium]|jgi:hypothetical protein|nr:hypothetical protein [Acidobacteriaceae bacterium]
MSKGLSDERISGRKVRTLGAIVSAVHRQPPSRLIQLCHPE